MNDVLKAIQERRSIRAFLPDMPGREDIDAITEAGLAAASGMNRQPVIIIAITDEDLRNKYSRANAAVMGSDGDPFYGAPVIIAVLARRDAATRVYDGSLALGNMMLAAHSLGLGSCWIHRAREVFDKDEWRELLNSLGIKGDYEGIGNLALGYPAASPKRPELRPNRSFAF